MMDIASQIKAAVAADQADMLAFTRALVAVGTENPPGKLYKQCIDVLARKLDEVGLAYEVLSVPHADEADYPRFCILSGHGTGDRVLYFHGHYDVVPASRDGQFDPYVEGGNLFGRGSSDMKSGLAAMIYAIKAIKTVGIDLDGRIGLVLVPDEETGGRLGTRFLAETGRLGENGVGMLLPEPTSGVIWNANRGAVSMRVTVKGKPMHVGLQYRGINAFEQMLKVAGAVQALKHEVEKQTTHYHIQPDKARRSILMMGGECRGGSNFNLVPGTCSFTIDRRINPEEDLETEKQRILDTLETVRVQGIDLEVDIFQEESASGVSEEDPLAEILSKNITEVTGKSPDFEMCPGLLENRFYAQKGVPAFAYGPGLLSVSHGPNEFVKIKDIEACTSVYALTAVDMLGTKKIGGGAWTTAKF